MAKQGRRGAGKPAKQDAAGHERADRQRDAKEQPVRPKEGWEGDPAANVERRRGTGRTDQPPPPAKKG